MQVWVSTVIMAANVAFSTTMQDNFEYILNENVRLRKELVVVKQHVEHLVAVNQWLSSHKFSTIEWQSAMQEEMGQMQDTMAQLYDEMILPQQVVAPLVGIQKKVQEVLKLLKVASSTVDQLQEWVAKQLNVSQQLVTKDKIIAEMNRVHLRLHHQNSIALENKRLTTLSLTVVCTTISSLQHINMGCLQQDHLKKSKAGKSSSRRLDNTQNISRKHQNRKDWKSPNALFYVMPLCQSKFT